MQAFFNGLSGLLAFSRGLKNVSNNVSNMNTPGFRGSDTFYRSVNGEGESGLGSMVSGTTIRQNQGEIRQTSNTSDAAINGRGFFIMQSEDGARYYSRAGQFKLDSDDYLVDAVTGHHVMALSATGTLEKISLAASRIIPPTATGEIKFAGNLITSASSHVIPSVSVYDKTGAKVELKIEFSRGAAVVAGEWEVSVLDASGAVLHTGYLRFSPGGSPAAGYNEFDFVLTSNGQSQTIKLHFGEPGLFSNATHFSGANSTLGASDIDGAPLAGLSAFSFDENGKLKLSYSNGETRDGTRLALASFRDESVMVHVAGSLYMAPDDTNAELGWANNGPLGKIQAGSIELSNIDLAQEFGEILIIQRGYQASSRVMTVANELLEQLYGGRSKG